MARGRIRKTYFHRSTIRSSAVGLTTWISSLFALQSASMKDRTGPECGPEVGHHSKNAGKDDPGRVAALSNHSSLHVTKGGRQDESVVVIERGDAL